MMIEIGEKVYFHPTTILKCFCSITKLKSEIHSITKDYIEWLDNYEVFEKIKNSRSTSDEEFFASRTIDVGTKPIFRVLEIDSGLEPTSEFKENEDWKNFFKWSSIHFALINDLFSLRREASVFGDFDSVI